MAAMRGLLTAFLMLGLAAVGLADDGRLIRYRERCQAELGVFPDLTGGRELSFPLDIFLNGRKVEEDLTYADTREHVEWKYIEDFRLKVCDNPSLANAGNPCNLFRSEMIRYRSSRPGVYWVGIARPHFPTGVIGWDSETGASCFFSVDDPRTWAPPKEPDNCMACHTNSDPFVVTKHLKEPWAKLGVPRKVWSFESGKYRFHVPGVAHSNLRPMSRTLEVEGNERCTGCHLLTLGGPQRDKVVLDAIGISILEKTVEGFLPKGWMPPRPRHDDEEREAVEAIRRYLQGQPEPRVKVTPVSSFFFRAAR